MKELIKKIPFVGTALVRLARVFKKDQGFVGSKKYWEARYSTGGNSGSGSYGRLAIFKAEVLNRFVLENNVRSVIELGCGDGHQLQLSQYPYYTGLDVSAAALEICKNKFKEDSTKTFLLYTPHTKEKIKLKAELALSLDVIYHLIEDKTFQLYMRDLFESAQHYVIIYSSNTDGEHQYHERPRHITEWISKCIKGWTLTSEIINPYPYDANDPDNTSQSNFFIYKK